MKLVSKTAALGVLTVVLAGTAYWSSPAVRAVFGGQVDQYLGWTESARQADPVGFINHVEGKLKEDVGKFQQIRRTLSGELHELTKKEQEQRALLADAEMYASEFRTAYQDGQFPVEVRHAAYTEESLRSQVGTTLAEIDAYNENIQRLTQVRQDAEAKIEELVVRIDKTEAQLAAISTQRELLKVRDLTTSGSQLLSQIDDLFNQNQVVITSNPVRSVRELQATGNQVQTSPSRTRVTAFLAQRGEGKVSVSFSKPKPSQPKIEEESVPIFQQSAIGK